MELIDLEVQKRVRELKQAEPLSCPAPESSNKDQVKTSSNFLKGPQLAIPGLRRSS